uniref:Mammalian ependymin-related protein 1 n=1 Tax=Magallana gigas TaxID=29159 RepID=K1QKU3_MAGGI
MSLILSIVGLSVLCHLSWARGCCVPKQWAGDMGFMVGTNRNGKGGYQAGMVKIFYDARNGKFAEFSKGVVDGRPFEGGVIMDFETGVQYTFMDGHCNTTRLSQKEFKEACIPEEAKAVSDTHMGTADDSLDVTVYQMARKRIGGNSYFTITNKLCVPVGETITGTLPRSGMGYMSTVGYTGIEPGIKDPRVFDKPRICSSQVEEGFVDLYLKFGFLNHEMSSIF